MINCVICDKYDLEKDTIGINKKLLGTDITNFYKVLASLTCGPHIIYFQRDSENLNSLEAINKLAVTISSTG